MSDIFCHFIVTHLQLKYAAVLRFTPLAVNIIAFKTTRLITDAISLRDEFIARRREHQSMTC